jgi:hypothetical protein
MRNSPAWKGIVAFLGACVALSLPSGCGKDAPTSAPEQPAKDPGRDDKTDPLADAKAHSKSNLKAIATAVGKFENQNYFLPVGLVDPKTARMGLSWRVQILPYLDDAKAPDLYKQFRLNEPWDSEHNGKLLASMPKVFAPVRGKAPEGHTYYQGFARHAVGVKLGQNAKPLASNEPFQDTFDTRGIFPDPRALFQVNGVPESGLPVKGPRLTGITDGTANTILAVEAGETVPWTKPQDVAFAVNLGDFLELKPKHDPKLGGLFDGDFHIVMVSGDVHYVKRGAPATSCGRSSDRATARFGITSDSGSRSRSG